MDLTSQKSFHLGKFKDEYEQLSMVATHILQGNYDHAFNVVALRAMAVAAADREAQLGTKDYWRVMGGIQHPFEHGQLVPNDVRKRGRKYYKASAALAQPIKKV